MGRARLSKDIVNERLAPRGIELASDFVATKVKAQFRCPKGHLWEAKPNTVLGGCGCPICAQNVPITKEQMIARLFDKHGSNITMIGEYESYSANTLFRCLNGHEWQSNGRNLIKQGHGCPQCAPNRPLTTAIINDALKDRGIQLANQYVTGEIMSDFLCDDGHLWEARAPSVLFGKGCPKCAQYGFNDGEPGWSYILDFGTYIKFGITNDLNRRLKEHLKNGDYTVVKTKLYERGLDARNWEKNIKVIFGGRYVTDAVCPDGWTETLAPEKLQRLLETVE
jgi:hypothetical protein